MNYENKVYQFLQKTNDAIFMAESGSCTYKESLKLIGVQKLGRSVDEEYFREYIYNVLNDIKDTIYQAERGKQSYKECLISIYNILNKKIPKSLSS